MSGPTHFCTSCGARFSSEVRFCPQDGQPLQAIPASSQPDHDPLLGSVIDGRYRIDSVLGTGGMGVVYLATHVVLNKRMALKVLRGDASRDEVTVQRFIQEATASTSIGHPNIVDISDFGRLPDGSAYFVMEHLEGETLTKRIRRGAMPAADVLHIALQIAGALGAAHTRGIVHRDLKPDNVFLIRRANDDRFVKLLDFGIAKVGGANSKLTRTGTVFGTPHYMSPEQAAGQSVTSSADIYALGVILFEMCTGKVPFDGDTFMGILSAHMFEDPPRPSEIAEAAGPLEGVIMRCLGKRPEDRYPSMESLVADLNTVYEGGDVAFAPVAPPSQVSGLPMMAAAAAPASSGTAMWVLGAVIGLLLVAGVGAGAWFALGGEAEARDVESSVVTELPAPPPTPPPQPAQAAEEPPEPVRLISEPVGAAVLVDGAVIGNTPLEVQRPEGDAALTLELRARDHLPREVRLSAASGAEVRVSLEPEPEPEPRRVTRRVPMTQTQVARTETMMAEPVMVTMRRVPNEVVDPWAND